MIALVSGKVAVRRADHVVIDCAGAPEAVEPALEQLAPRGLYIAVGYSRVPSFDTAKSRTTSQSEKSAGEVTASRVFVTSPFAPTRMNAAGVR